MPVTNKVGSGEHTQAKQDDFREWAALIIGMVDGITSAQKNLWKRHFAYIDINAGPGIHEGIIGSPLIALEELERRTLPYKAILIEQDKCNADKLRDRVGAKSLRFPPLIIQADHEQALRAVMLSRDKPSYGLIYHDPNGVVSFELLREASLCEQFRYMEIMIYLSANTIKRVRGMYKAKGLEMTVERLTDSIQSIHKKTWIIREPLGADQWTFLIGSDWDRFPEWRKRGFYRLDSPKGQTILHTLTYTKPEIFLMNQQPLFDLEELTVGVR